MAGQPFVVTIPLFLTHCQRPSSCKRPAGLGWQHPNKCPRQDRAARLWNSKIGMISLSHSLAGKTVSEQGAGEILSLELWQQPNHVFAKGAAIDEERGREGICCSTGSTFTRELCQEALVMTSKLLLGRLPVTIAGPTSERPWLRQRPQAQRPGLRHLLPSQLMRTLPLLLGLPAQKRR